MEIRDVCHALGRLAPLVYAEPWDNVGLLLGDPAAEVARVLLTIDLTAAVLAEAATQKCELVCAYHPPLFKPLKTLGPADLAYMPIRLGIAVYSMHTALDAAEGGTNATLCDVFGVKNAVPLVPSAKLPSVGSGRIGTLPSAIERARVIDVVKHALGLERVLVCGNTEGVAVRVAVAAGSGGSLLQQAIDQGADVFVTGELSHHDALRAARSGCMVIVTLHSNSERPALAPMQTRLQALLPSLQIMPSSCDRDPLSFR
jgi:dinuclear metal center YbgI/SA1388 family protein